MHRLTRGAILSGLGSVAAALVPVDEARPGVLAPIGAQTAAEQRRVLLETLLELHDATCPRLFTLHRVTEGKKGWLPGWVAGPVMDTFRLQLYCEYSRQPVGEPYEFTAPTEFVKSMAPLIRALDPILKGMRMLAPDPLTFLKIEALRAGAKSAADYAAGKPDLSEQDELDLIRGADYRALKAKLKELDPTERYRGMERVVAPNSRIMWVRPEAAAVLRRPPVLIPHQDTRIGALPVSG